jgi:hypothetical protein
MELPAKKDVVHIRGEVMIGETCGRECMGMLVVGEMREGRTSSVVAGSRV